MTQDVLAELKQYVRFGADDEAALRAFAPLAAPSFARIAEHFYARLTEHESARKVFTGPDQVERLKRTLQDWLKLLLTGPWDDDYYRKRCRIGRVHVKIGLPQRYMFGAMNVIRGELVQAAESVSFDGSGTGSPTSAIHKILDIELAIMLETYAEASLHSVQLHEREQREAVERKLELSQARYDEIVDKAEALIVTIDRAGHIGLFNATASRVTGIAPSDARDAPWLDLFALEADRTRLRAMFADVLQGKVAPAYEAPIQLSTHADPPRRVRWHFTTLPDRGAPALCAIGIDVSNEHELSVRTRRAERLAALGTMAAGLAHEIRNPLNAASLQLSVALRKLERDKDDKRAPVQSAVAVAESEMRRLSGLVDDFLQFARPQPLRLALVDLHAVVQEVIGLTEPEARAHNVVLALRSGPPVRLEVDVERIKQVLLNLVRNALEAQPVRTVELAVTGGAESAELTIQDDGPGFAHEAPIFEPFFTTKSNGTGLGLAIVHRIVMDHGGAISAESRPGRTLFRISLPIARSSRP